MTDTDAYIQRLAVSNPLLKAHLGATYSMFHGRAAG